jgi:hypothetical protein
MEHRRNYANGEKKLKYLEKNVSQGNTSTANAKWTGLRPNASLDDERQMSVEGENFHGQNDKSATTCEMNAYVQGGSNMTGTNCDLFTHKQSRSYLNHLVVNPSPHATASKPKVRQRNFPPFYLWTT